MTDQQDPQQQPAQVSFAPQAHSVLYSDFAQITINPHSATLRFGTQVPGRNEFVVHTQLAMPPQALVAFANAIQQHLQAIAQAQANARQQEDSGLVGPDGPIDLSRLN
ncbi:MAG: hypothetical protein GEEBNDBF_00278 [bacterium]|nr:hypothetical protein [bacterium]